MKKIYLFMAAAVIAVSCSDDDNAVASVNPDPSSLIGKWKFSKTWYAGQQEDLGCEESTTHEYQVSGVLKADEYYGIMGDCKHYLSTTSYNYSEGVITTTNPNGGYDGGMYITKYKILELTDEILRYEAIYQVDEVVPGHGPYEDAPYEGDIPQQYRWIDEYTRQ